MIANDPRTGVFTCRIASPAEVDVNLGNAFSKDAIEFVLVCVCLSVSSQLSAEWGSTGFGLLRILAVVSGKIMFRILPIPCQADNADHFGWPDFE